MKETYTPLQEIGNLRQEKIRVNGKLELLEKINGYLNKIQLSSGKFVDACGCVHTHTHTHTADKVDFQTKDFIKLNETVDHHHLELQLQLPTVAWNIKSCITKFRAKQANKQ